MSQAKYDLFDEDEQNMALLFKALAHPARIQILKFLASSEVCFSGDLSDVIPLGRTTIHQHLNELKKVGLIQGVVAGSKTNYCLNSVVINKLACSANSLFNELVETKLK